MATDRKSRLLEFADWAAANITGDEKGESLLFLNKLFQAFGQKGLLEVGGTPEFRIRKAKEDGGGTAFADYVWKPLVLIEMKKRGTDLRRTYRQAFDYWTRLVPNYDGGQEANHRIGLQDSRGSRMIYVCVPRIVPATLRFKASH